ncbi:hypothetical protein CPB85DRAFT_1357492, partial [Mucidula mucida]
MSTMTLQSTSRRNPFASTNTGNQNAAQGEQTAAPNQVERISQEQHGKILVPDSEETSEPKEGNSFSEISQSALDGSYSLEYNYDGHAHQIMTRHQ